MLPVVISLLSVWTLLSIPPTVFRALAIFAAWMFLAIPVALVVGPLLRGPDVTLDEREGGDL
jgi:hypothetical protein